MATGQQPNEKEPTWKNKNKNEKEKKVHKPSRPLDVLTVVGGG